MQFNAFKNHSVLAISTHSLTTQTRLSTISWINLSLQTIACGVCSSIWNEISQNYCDYVLCFYYYVLVPYQNIVSSIYFKFLFSLFINLGMCPKSIRVVTRQDNIQIHRIVLWSKFILIQFFNKVKSYFSLLNRLWALF